MGFSVRFRIMFFDSSPVFDCLPLSPELRQRVISAGWTIPAFLSPSSPVSPFCSRRLLSLLGACCEQVNMRNNIVGPLFCHLSSARPSVPDDDDDDGGNNAHVCNWRIRSPFGTILWPFHCSSKDDDDNVGQGYIGRCTNWLAVARDRDSSYSRWGFLSGTEFIGR